MPNIDGPDGVTPEQRKVYKQDCLKSAQLFKEALEKHHDSKEVPQKEAFEKVMNDALKVMNQTAKWGCRDHKLEEKKEKDLNQDYQKYLEDDNDKNYQNLQKDIQEFKRSL